MSTQSGKILKGTYLFRVIFVQFFLGMLVGLYSYLMPGYINLSIFQSALSHPNSTTQRLVVLITLVEVPYCFGCMLGIHALTEGTQVLLVIRWMLVGMLLLLFVLSLRDYFKKRKQHTTFATTSASGLSLKQLFFFIVFNPFQLSAWAVWGSYFLDKTWFSWTVSGLVLFSFGTALGVYLILQVYALTGKKFLKHLSHHRSSMDLFSAGLFLVLAIYQIVINLQA